MLAALPSGAKGSMRLCCRAGRAGVDAHRRRLQVKRGRALLSAAAAARMPLLQELDLSASDDSKVVGLAAGLQALAEGPAVVTRAKVWIQGSASALDRLVSALAGLTALTRLELIVSLEGSQLAMQPLA